jgi:hypothetical protein
LALQGSDFLLQRADFLVDQFKDRRSDSVTEGAAWGSKWAAKESANHLFHAAVASGVICASASGSAIAEKCSL